MLGKNAIYNNASWKIGQNKREKTEHKTRCHYQSENHPEIKKLGYSTYRKM